MSSDVSSPYGAPPMDCSTTADVSSDSACDAEGGNFLVIIAGIGFVAMLAMMPFFLQRRGYCGGMQPATHAHDAQIQNDEKRQHAIDECLVSKKVVIHGITDTLELMEEGKVNEAEESRETMDSDVTSSMPTVEQGQVDQCVISTCSTPETNDTVSLGSFSDDPCHICLETFAMGDEFVISNVSGCQHGFHRSCISEWLRKHDECPCCRAKFFALKDDTEEEDT